VRVPVLLLVVASIVVGGIQASAASRESKKNKDDASETQRFSIHPNDITLAVSQKQIFGVTDAAGKQVAVRWKISGVGCSTSTCGTIDENGNYQAPFSVSRPLVVMLEGIPVANAEYPAFARIQLAPGTAPVPSPLTGSNKDTVANAQPVGIAPAPTVSISTRSIQSGNATPSQIAITQAAPAPLATNLPSATGSIVTYQNGQLAINATNETLANVLRLVAKKTGATIDIPPGTGLERIVVHAGPASPSDVLRQLLKGSRFNFVLIGYEKRPNDLQQVLLTPRVDTEAPVIASVTTPVPTPVDVPAEAPPSTGIVDRVYSGPVNGGPQPRSREEIRELLKERASEQREQSQPFAQPQPQAQTTAPEQPAPPADSQPAESPAAPPQ
jgi:hypothetical protein